MNDSRHKLDLSPHIRWRVAARGFVPISIQFEFDRQRMFEILGRDIYQGDTHVFLRELLQNSIDAIRVRRAAFLRRGMVPPHNLGVIQVDVKDGENGDKVITWKDDGSGMDEHIIRKYLAVAGKSYYGSPEFERMGLKIDPISFFGIGILSCFIVADRIEIDTFKERYLPSPSKPLRIVIPAADRQFRIEEGNEETAEVGTTLRVFVQGKKLPSKEPDFKRGLHVTEYLCKTAGFVEFPIAINENGKKTLILHPSADTDAKAALGKNFADYDLRQTKLDYPWSEVVAAQDITNALEIFRQGTFDLKTDLGLADYEGLLQYPIPVNLDTDFGEERNTLAILSSHQGELGGKSIRWIGRPQGMLLRGFWTVEERLSSNAIYRDGVLVSNASFSSGDLIEPSEGIPIPIVLIVNVPKSRARMIDVARKQITSNSDEWAKPIFEAWIAKLSERYRESFIKLEPTSRLHQMMNFCVFHHIPFKRLHEIVPSDYWPVLFLEAGGSVATRLFNEARGSKIFTLPGPLVELMTQSINSHFWGEQPHPLMEKWRGTPCMVHFATRSVKSESIMLKKLDYFLRWIRQRYYRFDGIQFVSPPWTGDPQMLQEIWVPKEVHRDIIEGELTKREIEMVVNDPKLASTKYRQEFIEESLGFVQRRLGDYEFYVRIASFPNPYQSYFAYGDRMLNIDHPAVQAMIRLTGRYALVRLHGGLSTAASQNMAHALGAVLMHMPGGIRGPTYDDWLKRIAELKWMASKTRLMDDKEQKIIVPVGQVFVPGSLEEFPQFKVKETWDKPFGVPFC